MILLVTNLFLPFQDLSLLYTVQNFCSTNCSHTYYVYDVSAKRIKAPQPYAPHVLNVIASGGGYSGSEELSTVLQD
jgi:hypothetical protein